MSSTAWKRPSPLIDHAKTSIWKLPEPDEHFLNSSSPEDLFLNPEDLDVVPGQIQDGMNAWNKEAGPLSAGWYPSPSNYNVILSTSSNDWYSYPSNYNTLLIISRNDWYPFPSEYTLVGYWY